ncbi:MAG: peptidase E [Rhodospirillales bacterium]|nr:peptidase E [Rhodospirillales bacterium]
MRQHIIALGGGGFSIEPDNPLLDLYVLKQATADIPKICFLPTASGDADSYLLKYYQAFSRYSCHPSHLSLFRPHTANMQDFLLSQDIIYVGGGNTKSMLALWKEWNIDQILRKAYERGIVLAGISAGAICWFEHGATDSIPGKISVLECLGLLKGSLCPHYDSEPLRKETVPGLIAQGQMKPGYAVDDSAAVHFIDGQYVGAVSSVKGKRVLQLTPEENSLEVSYLGS